MKPSEFVLSMLILFTLLFAFFAALWVFIYGITEIRKGEQDAWVLVGYGGLMSFAFIILTISLVLESMGY